MQWLLQQFEDTEKLGIVLQRMQVPFSWHKVVPFIGELDPEPIIHNPRNTILFGSYTLWRYAKKYELEPGVFRIDPFIDETAWFSELLNGDQSIRLPLKELPSLQAAPDKLWFIRPVEDSKEIAGTVKSSFEIQEMASRVLALDADEIPNGSLRPETEMILSEPVEIQKEWRIWVVDNVVVAFSLYKEGRRVIYRPEIDDDALAFAEHLVQLNPHYAKAYVMDICRTREGLKLLETNCINAAGFYAADIEKIVLAIEALD